MKASSVYCIVSHRFFCLLNFLVYLTKTSSLLSASVNYSTLFNSKKCCSFRFRYSSTFLQNIHKPASTTLVIGTATSPTPVTLGATQVDVTTSTKVVSID